MTFAQKLIKEKKDFDSRNVGSYKKPSMPEVLMYLKEYIATGEYPYNARVAKYILSKEAVPDDLKDYLETEVYLAQKDLKEEKGALLDNKMLGEGFLKISWNTEYRGNAELIAKKDVDLMSTKISLTGKIISDSRGTPFFIPKGKRSRGYSFVGLEGYYKPIKL